jgi:PKHD-type hydroxylase
MGVSGDTFNYTHRNTTVRFSNRGHWFEEHMKYFANLGNKECQWDYDIQDHENIQFAEYGPEQHYNWHVDVFPLSGQSTDRKITVVCLLNELSEFTGGEFQIRLYSEYVAPLTKGSVIAFPSFLEHRVTPVTSGMRKSATIWLNGPRFR